MLGLTHVYDPTVKDSQSKVRGIGRYLQILKENFEEEFIFTDKITNGSPAIFINPFFNFLSPPLTMKRVAKRQIAVIHDLIPLKYPSHFPTGLKGKIYMLLNRFALGSYDLIITDSHASKNDIVNLLHIGEEKIKVVYPCLPEAFTNLPDTPSEYKLPAAQYCIYVGDGTWNKNLVNIAKAIKRGNIPCMFVGKVFAKNNEAPLVNPWQRELSEFLHLANDDKRFIFPGYIKDKDLAFLYKNAAVNILVSRDEGFGFSYVEASYFNCPSILADIPLFHEIAQDAAEFVNGESSEAIAKAISAHVSNARNKDLKNRARERANLYNRTNFKTQMLQAIT